MTVYPKISIVTPSYNQGKYLEKTILSVLEQGYPNLEYIIIDGGSSDESVEIIRKYADRLAYWDSEPDRGQSHAINKGFARATGEIFGWLNSDDWYQPDALLAVAEAFAANPEAGAVVGAGDMYSEEYNCTQTIEPFPVSMQSLYGAVDRFFMQPSCFFTATAWRESGPLDESLHLAMDLDLWLSIAKKFSYVVIDKNLSVSLVHQSAKTTALAPQSLVDASLVIMKHGGVVEGRNRLVAFVQELYDTRGSLDTLRVEKAQLIIEKEQLEIEIEQLGLEKKYQLSEISRLQMETVEYSRTIHEMKRYVQGKEQQLAAYENSLSWRVTQPLRRLGQIFAVAAAPQPLVDPAEGSYLDLDRLAEIATARKTDKATVLVLDFNLGGGSNLYSRGLIAHLELIGHKVFVMEYRYGLKDFHVEYNSGTGIAEVAFTGRLEDNLTRLVQKLAVDIMIVSQLVTWPITAEVLAKIIATGVRYHVLIHDYFFVCPNWTLFDYQEKYCGVPEDPEICAHCLQRLRELDIPLEQHTRAKRIEAWRSCTGPFLAEADKVICFSDASREVIMKAYPDLKNTQVIEHSIPESQLFSWQQRYYLGTELLTIAVIGGISLHKGSRLVDQLVTAERFNLLPVRMVIIGDILPLPSSSNDRLIVHGGYSRRELPDLLEKYHVSAVLIPSLWPETFCFTASEALLLGYPLICCDIGAQADRVRRHDAGWVVKMPYLEGIIALLQKLVETPQLLAEKSLRAREYLPLSADDNFSAMSELLSCTK